MMACDKLTTMLPFRVASWILGLIGVWAAIVLVPTSSALAAASGEEVYAKRCASCHDQTNPRIPPRESLKKIPATRILKVLDFGVMMQIAYQMSRQDREAVAKFLGTDAPETVLSPEAFCNDRTVAINDK